MKNIITYVPGTFSFARWIIKRIDNNLNFNAFFEGETGVGKSYNALSIAYMIDTDFDLRQVAFDFIGVMRIINADWFKKKKYKIIIFDECQVDISNREWQSKVNRLMNYLMSTYRHQNVILFLTAPFSDMIDAHTKKMLHCIFDCKGWNKKTSKSTIRPKLQQYNPKLKKFYEHSLFVIRNGRAKKMVTWVVPKPPQHLVIPYEEAKTKFTSALNADILKELEQDSAPAPVQDTSDVMSKLDLDSMQPIIYEIAIKGYKDQDDLADKVGKIKGRLVTQGEISRNVISMRKKGVDIRLYKGKGGNNSAI